MKLHTTSLNLLSGITLLAICCAASAAPTAKTTAKTHAKKGAKVSAMKHTKSMSHKTKSIVVPTSSKTKAGSKMSAKPAVKG